MQRLPIDDVLPQIRGYLEEKGRLVLEAEPGAGKTTRIAPYLLREVGGGGGRILMLEPRRLAARQAARRIAAEQGWSLGGEVGYQVRFERCASEATQLLVTTEGLALRMLGDDPFLEGVSLVIFDEFHERQSASDLMLAALYRLQQEIRADLRILVMSATLPSDEIADYLGGAPILRCVGRSFPVRLAYAEMPQERGRAAGIGEMAAWGIRKSLSEVDGDLLVFLPGMREIREATEKVQAFAREKSLRILPLYGEQSLEEQDAALAAYPERKVILATNIAETSLTIAGVRGVVDTGWARKLRYDTGCGLNRLETERISEASAIQRMGRAGREAEGYALRLWSPSLALDAQDEPEIQRIELSALLLQMLAWGERELASFPWVSAPSEAALEQSLELLELLDATKRGDLTEKGKKMAVIPLEPRLSAFLLEAQERGVAEDAAWLAALLSERHPFSQRLQEQTPRHLSDIESDLLDQFSLLREVSEGASWASSNEQRSYRRLQQIQQQLLALLGVSARKKPASLSLGEREGHLARALLAGYVDRLALRRPQDPQRAILSSGRGLRMAKSCQVKRAGLFLALELDAGKREERAEAWVQQASAVEESWLPRESLREEIEVRFDHERERVIGLKKRMFRQLVLQEQSIQPPDEEAASLLAEAAASQLGRALGLEEEKRQQFLLRLRLLSRWLPEVDAPAFDEAYLLERLPMWCEGKRSFQALREMPLEQLWLGDLSYAQATALRDEIPERIEVPSGSMIQIEYREDAPPILAVRIQEIFGWYDTPCLAQGRVPLLLHLLAPNHRPQQITQDLRSFWNSAYPEIRKELRQRYPKHAWPEDPLTAKAERRPQRRSFS